MDTTTQVNPVLYAVGAATAWLLYKKFNSTDEVSETQSKLNLPAILFAAFLYSYRSELPRALPIVTPVVASNAALHYGMSYSTASALAVATHLIICSCLKDVQTAS